jgi:hypothetical protein
MNYPHHRYLVKLETYCLERIHNTPEIHEKVPTWSRVLCIQKYSVLYHNFNLRKINIDHPSCHVSKK